jgi:hypothetical protein
MGGVLRRWTRRVARAGGLALGGGAVVRGGGLKRRWVQRNGARVDIYTSSHFTTQWSERLQKGW